MNVLFIAYNNGFEEREKFINVFRFRVVFAVLSSLTLCGAVGQAAKAQQTAAPVKTAKAASAAPRTLVLTLSGLHCESCEGSVKRRLASVPGVIKVVSVSAKEQKAVVQVGPKSPQTAVFKAAVAETGYKCLAVKAKR